MRSNGMLARLCVSAVGWLCKMSIVAIVGCKAFGYLNWSWWLVGLLYPVAILFAIAFVSALVWFGWLLHWHVRVNQ